MYNLITPNQLFLLCVGKRSPVDTWAHLIALGPLCHLETALIRGWLLAQVPLPTHSLSFPLSQSPFFFFLSLSPCWGGRKRPGSLADSHTLSHSSHPACLILVQTLYKTCQDPLWANAGQTETEVQPSQDVIIPGKIAALASGCSWAIRRNKQRHWEQSARKGYLKKPFCKAQG